MLGKGHKVLLPICSSICPLPTANSRMISCESPNLVPVHKKFPRINVTSLSILRLRGQRSKYHSSSDKQWV